MALLSEQAAEKLVLPAVVSLFMVLLLLMMNSGLGQLVERVGEGGELGLHLLLGVVVHVCRIPG